MKIICVIPAYNEELLINDVINNVKNFVDEIIVIDDGSTDGTTAIAKANGAIVVSHPRNLGVGAAFNTGVSKALEAGADIMITIDADNQFKAEEIPKLIDPILKDGVDFVTGSRFLDQTTDSHSTRVKRFGNRFFTNIVNRLVNQKFTDTQCGFRAYSREALLRLTTFGKFTYTQEVFLDLANKNMRIVEIPVEVNPRKVGKSHVVKNPINYGLRASKIILQFERDFHPLRFFGAIGLAFLIPGLILLLFTLLNWLMTGMSSPYTSLISIGGMLILVAIIFIILALIADMNGRQRLLQEELLYLARKQYYKHSRGGKDS